MARSQKVIAPEAQSMDLVAQKREENLSVASEILKAFNVLQEQEYEQLLYIQTGRNMFQLHQMSGLIGGAVLLIIKEHEKHGVFTKALDQIGIHPRKAQLYMNYARRFGKYEKFSHLNNSKLDLLDDLTDPELEKLNSGGEVNGMTLDDWDTMTATQIRTKAREMDAKLRVFQEKLDRIEAVTKAKVRQKDEQISEMEFEIEHVHSLTKEEKAAKAAGAKLNEWLKPFNGHLQDAMFAINRCIGIISEIQCIDAVSFPQLNDWILKHSENLTSLTETLAELNDAVEDILIEKA